ncbi:MAG: thioredoxin family protein [Pirellulales bacterium]
MLRIRTVGLVLSLIAAASGSSALAGESAVRWQSDIDAALATAAQTNRLVLVHFWRPSCQPCMRLEANVFNQPQFAAALEADYVPVKINTDQFPETTRRYGIEMLPTDVILTPDGKVASTAPCPQDGVEYAQRLRQTAASIRRTDSQFAQADRSTTGRSTDGRDTTQNAAANYAQYAPSESMGGGRITAVESPATPSQPTDNERRYGNDFDARRSPVATAQYGNGPSYADAATPARAATPRMTTRDVTPTQSDREVNSTGLPYGNPNPAASVAATGGQGYAGNTAGAPRDAGYAAGAGYASAPPAASRGASGQPSLCLDGHCPVTLMETQRWVYGDRRFGAVHRGRLYLFSGAEAQQRFLADPDKYSPALSGHDAVAWVEQGQLIPGERKFGGYFRGYIYLFANEESLRQFEANPERYAGPVEHAVAAGRGRGQVRR